MNGFYLDHLTLIQATLVGMVLAASMQVAMRAGVFSLASVGLWGVGAYTAGVMARDHGAGLVLALLAAVVMAAVLGYLLALVFVRLSGMYLAMASMAFDLVVVVVALQLESVTGGALGLYAIPPLMTTGGIVVVLVVVAAVLTWTEVGHVGRTVSTVGADVDLARSLGIDVRKVQRRAFVLSSVLGALAGGMSALLFNTVAPDQFGFHLVTMALTMAVLGGLRSWVGAFIGAVIVYWLPEVLRPVADWRSAVYGALLIVVLAWEPRGLLGLIGRAVQLVRRRPPVRAVGARTLGEEREVAV